MSTLDELRERAQSLSETGGAEFEAALRDYQLAVKEADVSEPSITPQPPPLRTVDLRRSLALEEGGVYRRFSPRRNRWGEVAEFDRRVEELEERQRSLTDELRALQERHGERTREDREALAKWAADDSGPRPEPTAPAVEERITELTENRAAIGLAVEKVLAEKAEFVAKHRRRLKRDAQKATEQATAAYKRLLGELEQARSEALECRRAELWAALFPAQLAVTDLGGSLVLGGRKLKSVAWYVSQTTADSVLELLRADAEWVSRAASPEQQQAIDGTDPRHDPETFWAESPEGQQTRERHSHEARKRIENAQWQGVRWEED